MSKIIKEQQTEFISKKDKQAVFIFGIIAIVVILSFWLFIILIPAQPGQKEFVYGLINTLNIILAIALAGIASRMPGFLELLFHRKFKRNNEFMLSASGALAVFVIVLFVVNPGEKVKNTIEKSMEFSRLFSSCKRAVSWDRGNSRNVLGTAAKAYCMQFVKRYPDRWEPYDLFSQYYWFIEDYDNVYKSSRKAADIIEEKSSSTSKVDLSRLYQRMGSAKVGMIKLSTPESIDKIRGYYDTAEEILKDVEDEILLYDLHYYRMIAHVSDVVFLDNTDNCKLTKKYLDELLNEISPYGNTWIYYHMAVLSTYCTQLEYNNPDQSLLAMLEELATAEMRSKYAKTLYGLLLTENIIIDRPNDPVISDKLRKYIASNMKMSNTIRDGVVD